jgi:hypothetical protein
MPVEWKRPKKINSYRVMICGGIQQGWYETDSEERRKKILPRFMDVVGGWQKKPGVRLVGSMDDDLFTVGPSGSSPWNFFLLYDIDDLEKVVSMMDSIRRHEAGKPILDHYFRFEAIIGRPFSWLEEQKQS